MFRKDKKLIIYLRRETLKTYLVDAAGVSQNTGEYPWTTDNLETVLRKIIKQENQKMARVLLDDTLGYLWDLEVPLTEKDEKNYIVQKIAAKLPEVLENQDWNFKEVGQTKEAKIIRVFAPARNIWKLFTLNCLKVGLTVEAVETVSLALERNKDPVVGLATKTDVLEKREEKTEVLENKPVKLTVEVVGGEGEKTVVEPTARVEEVPAKKKFKIDKTFVLIILGMALLTALILGGVLVYHSSLNQSGLAGKPTPTVWPTPTAEISPTPSLKISDLQIKILNGSGIAGEAGVVKKYLEDLGYQNITTGNADSFNYKGMELAIKKGKEELKSQLTQDLSKKFTLTETLKTVESTNENDVIIIVGKK